MKQLLLIGGGGHCRSCIDVVEATSMYQIIGVVNQNVSSEFLLGYPIIGSDNDLPKLLEISNLALIAVGQIKTPETRVRLYNILKKLNAVLPVVISPYAYCSRHSVIGEATIVMHGAIINSGVKIGKNCIINSRALIEHDVEISDNCHISTNVCINGGVTIDSGSFIGSGTIVKEGVKIGKNVVISAGQVILCDIPNGMVVKHE